MSDLPERDKRKRKTFSGRSGNYQPFSDLPLHTPFPIFDDPVDWGELGETTGDDWRDGFGGDFGSGDGDAGGCDGGE